MSLMLFFVHEWKWLIFGHHMVIITLCLCSLFSQFLCYSNYPRFQQKPKMMGKLSILIMPMKNIHGYQLFIFFWSFFWNKVLRKTSWRHRKNGTVPWQSEIQIVAKNQILFRNFLFFYWSFSMSYKKVPYDNEL